jgi:hypothetical protein
MARDQAEAKYANLEQIHLRDKAQFESDFNERERVIGECKKRSEQWQNVTSQILICLIKTINRDL